MRNEPAIKAAIRNGLAYLTRQQGEDGGFVSYSSDSIRPFKPSVTYATTFAPALILASLTGINDKAAMAIRRRLARFLLRQKSPAGSFNYWAKDSAERRTQPYPDDLDDTFCALIGLYLHDPAIISEEILARTVKLLVATETAAGGPYRTWLVPRSARKPWLNTDLAVNSNINYFLSLVSNALPGLNAFMEQAILDGKLVSAYYPSSYPLIYYFSRSYKGPRTADLVELARRAGQAEAIRPLEQALYLSAMINLGAPGRLDSIVGKLVSAQNDDGSWPADAFCMDPSRAGKPYYHGAPALSTALAIEALQSYLKAAFSTGDAKPKRITALNPGQKLQKGVLAMAERHYRSLDEDLRLSTIKAVQEIATSTNGSEIMTLPYYFSQSLVGTLSAIPDNFFEALGLANLSGWLAYTIYDDFLDEEGRPELISVANVAMRGSLRSFNEALSGDEEFQAIVEKTFDKIDGANAWEIAHCRFSRRGGWLIIDKPLPDYGNPERLADRSLGHTLTPLAVLFIKGAGADSKAFKQTQKALIHYLTARQLNDDAHDWQDDLRKGRITYVVASVLAEMDAKPGRHRLSDLVPAMQKQFWYHSLPAICRQMQRQIDLGRRALRQSPLSQPTNVITELLDGIEASVKETLSTQAQAGNFLKHYTHKAG